MKENAIYTVFSRSCTDWQSFGSARKRTIETGLTIEEARRVCAEFNNNRTAAQIKRGTKYEFTS